MTIPENKKVCSICANRTRTAEECKRCKRNSAFQDNFTLSKEVESYLEGLKDGFEDSQDLHTL